MTQGVLQLKLVMEINNVVVPPQLSAVDHYGLCRGEKRLVVEPIWKIVRVSTGKPPLFLRTRNPWRYELVPGNDTNGQAPHVEPLHRAYNIGCYPLKRSSERSATLYRTRLRSATAASALDCSAARATF